MSKLKIHASNKFTVETALKIDGLSLSVVKIISRFSSIIALFELLNDFKRFPARCILPLIKFPLPLDAKLIHSLKSESGMEMHFPDF